MAWSCCWLRGDNRREKVSLDLKSFLVWSQDMFNATLTTFDGAMVGLCDGDEEGLGVDTLHEDAAESE